MSSSGDEYDIVKKYLLGQLSGEDREKFEQRYFTDDRLYEELLAGEDELVDDFVTNDLSEDEVAMFHENFLVGAERQQKLQTGRALRRYAALHGGAVRPTKTEPAGSWQWQHLFASPAIRLAALAAAILVTALGTWRIFFFQSEVDKGLVALNEAYRQQRPLESRLTQLDYAPFVITRGSEPAKFNEAELRRAELTLLEALKNNPTPAVYHALGKVYLTKKDFDRAIEQFNESAKRAPNDAQLFNDLGAAYLERGKLNLEKGRTNSPTSDSGKGLEDFARSLEALNKALTLNPSLLEARFNRALVYQAMVLPNQAEADWKSYLEKDSASQWAEEAKRRLNELQDQKKNRTQNQADPLTEFIAAHNAGNDVKALQLISMNSDAISGKLIWWRLAGAYLDAESKRETDTAESYLRALAYSGQLQEKKAGDRFISELAGFYESTSLENHVALAQAHAMINEAHVLMSKSKAAEALRLYQKAKIVFDQAGDQWESLFAVYWLGYCRYRKSEFKEALSVFTQLAEHCRAKSYLWLLGKTITAIGSIRVDLSQFSISMPYQAQSLEISEKINDVYNTQKSLALLAYSYRNLGNRQRSLAYIQRCLESAVAWPGARQMYRNYYTASDILNSFGYYSAAVEYEKAALMLALDEAKDPGFEHLCYVHLSAIYAKLGDYGQALRYAELSHQKAQLLALHTSSLPTADSLLQLGHINRQTGNHDKAIAHYDEAVRLYDGMKLFAFLYEAQKGRLLNYIAQKNDSQASQQLKVVLDLFEGHREKIREEKNRNSFFDLEQNVYDIAIDFEYSRTHDYKKAYEYSEVSRARSLLDLMNAGAEAAGDNDPEIVISSVSQPLRLDKIQEQIPEETQILQYAVLDDKLLAWVISKDKFGVAEQKITSSILTEKVTNYLKSVSTISASDSGEARRASIELYDILIKPVESLLEKNKEICVVPDKALNSLPFNALISPLTGKFLINDFVFVFSPSSNVFLAASAAARQRSVRKDERVLSVGDPLFDHDAFPDLPGLPTSGKEAKQIADYYKSSSLLVGNEAKEETVRDEIVKADVVHIASHYVVDEHNPMLSTLLLTGGSSEQIKHKTSDGILQAYEISKTKLPITRLVALSACQTGVERYYNGEGMIGMSRTFLAAGVPLVAASMWAVPSDPTVDLMTNFHRYRQHSDLSTAEALRKAQLDFLHNRQHPYDQPYYWASFVVIGGYAPF